MSSTHSRKIKTIIVDDEPPARRNLRALLKPAADIDLVKECGNGRDAVSGIRALEPDLVFLDVQMPEMDGFEVLEQLSDQPMPVIIFVTAYDQYALKAFEVSALDYLLKPFDDARFHKALAAARRQIEQQDASLLGNKLLTLIESREIAPDSQPRFPARLMIKTTGRVIFIRTDEVDWIEACDNYVQLHVGGKTHLLRQTMTELEGTLNPKQFARIHRKTIVNLDRVTQLVPHVNEHLVVLQDGTELKVSRSRREWLEQWLGRKPHN